MGDIYLYTGSGVGKTTSALGLALRAVGQGKKVIIIQFMKGRKNIGEYKIQKRLKPELEIYQFGRPGFVELKKPKKIDYELAKKGLEFAKKALRKKPFLLILDEVNLACAIGLIKTNEVLELLKTIPKNTHVVLTGRRAPKELIDRAEYVNVLKVLKQPKLITAKKGIQY